MLLSFLYAGYFVGFSTIALLNSFVNTFFLDMQRPLKTFRKLQNLVLVGFFFTIIIIRAFYIELYDGWRVKCGTGIIFSGYLFLSLHFQYNLSFYFSRLGLLFYHLLKEKGIFINSNRKQMIFGLLFIGCFTRLRFIGFMVETACLGYLVIVLATLASNHGTFVFFKWIKNQWPKIKPLPMFYKDLFSSM